MLGFKPKEQTDHEETIAELYRKMLDTDTTPEDYKTYLEQLERLHKIHDPNRDKDRATLKDWIPVIGSIGAVVIVLVYETTGHSFTSKAVSFIRKV